MVGLFQGIFECNLRTFNPGWDQHKQEPASFQDVGEVQAELDAKGIALTARTDPHGNVILIDPHVARPTGR
ncbi:hypothetical protein [Stenotrophomonas indicatrix]|uniref:hypothetical protein n=1 Tax=Stenotrophomonas indicatrix TaxID=2045451 RepID=UPI000A9B16D8|nr:hypothetical protein [Stenotrophomonas indicatrix]MCR8716859.1 hypothetical protein [Stenotrophomonas indicatrix]